MEVRTIFSVSAIRKGNKDLRSKSFLVFYYIFEFAKNRMLSVAFAGSGRYTQGAIVCVNAIKGHIAYIAFAKVSPMQMYAFQGQATIKCPPANIGYTVGESDAFQRGAIPKCTLTNRGYTEGKGDAFQGGATIKCRLANRGYTVGKGDTFQRGAILKCKLANRGYTEGKGDAFQGGATR